VPRGRILKDEALLELASNRPRSHDDLGKSRLLLRDARRGEVADAILAAIAAAEALPASELPRPETPPVRKPGSEALSELLRVLLKARAETSGVAQRLIASSAELDRLAAEAEPDVPALIGWRFDLFGRDALRLKRGEIGLSASDGLVAVVELSRPAA
jgi:ribonuclease D